MNQRNKRQQTEKVTLSDGMEDNAMFIMYKNAVKTFAFDEYKKKRKMIWNFFYFFFCI